MTAVIELPTELFDAEFARFTKFVDWSEDSTECWEWLGATNPDGYGRFSLGGRLVQAHRLGWQLHHRSLIPDGRDLDHLCSNRECVNPAHLEPVSTSINCQRGRRAKLAPLDVQLIRVIGDALPQHRIGAAFGIAQSTVGRILSSLIQPGYTVATWDTVSDIDPEFLIDVITAVRKSKAVA